jgi:hypothetical protein
MRLRNFIRRNRPKQAANAATAITDCICMVSGSSGIVRPRECGTTCLGFWLPQKSIATIKRYS